MKNTALLLLLLFTFISCKTNQAVNSSDTSLNGKWNWVSSSGGFTGKTITAESEKKTIVIEIYNSIIKKYENGKLLSKNTFSIKTQPSIFGGERKMIVPEDNGIQQSFEIKDNVLYLNEECNDCYNSQYVQMK